jgi:hypothetical protein
MLAIQLNHFLLKSAMSGLLNYYFRRGMNDDAEGIVTVTELRNMLYRLQDKSPDTCIRFRLIGKMWNDSFMNVRDVTDLGIAFVNRDASNQQISISNLANVIQFELENSFENYRAHFHYSVQP